MYGSALPASPGTYVLLLHSDRPIEISPGGLGRWKLPAGRYAYIGSARGPGGLRARVTRHLRPDKPLHWHIDHVTAQVPVIAVLTGLGVENRECACVQALLRLPGVVAIAPGFGSSDCRSGCPAHLLLLPDGISVSELRARLEL
jgi:Uri superfamily endonuclease